MKEGCGARRGQRVKAQSRAEGAKSGRGQQQNGSLAVPQLAGGMCCCMPVPPLLPSGLAAAANWLLLPLLRSHPPRGLPPRWPPRAAKQGSFPLKSPQATMLLVARQPAATARCTVRRAPPFAGPAAAARSGRGSTTAAACPTACPSMLRAPAALQRNAARACQSGCPHAPAPAASTRRPLPLQARCIRRLRRCAPHAVPSRQQHKAAAGRAAAAAVEAAEATAKAAAAAAAAAAHNVRGAGLAAAVQKGKGVRLLSPVLPCTLILSTRNFSKEAISMI